MRVSRKPTNFEFVLLAVVIGLGAWWICSDSDVARYCTFAAMSVLFVARIFIKEKEKE